MEQDSRRKWSAVALAAVVAFALATAKVTSSDTWVHLSLGRWIAHRWQVPVRNVLSYTEPNRPTVDHQWLFQLCLYGVERGVGISGAIVVKALVVAGAFGLACGVAVGGGASPGAALVVAAVAACAARFRFTVRPQVVSFLLLSVYLLALRRWRSGRALWLLATLPLQVVWANVHGGAAVLGYGIVVLYAFGETISELVARRWGVGKRPARHLATLWAVGAACGLLTMLNPNGAKVLALPFTHAFAQAASGLKGLLLDRSAVTAPELGGRHFFLALLTPLVLVSLVVEAFRLRFADFLLLLGLLAAAFTSERFVGILAIAAAHVAPGGVTAVLKRCIGREGRRRSAGVGFFGAAVLSGVLPAVAILVTGARQPFGLGVALRLFPRRELEVIADRFPSARLLNEFEDGGYIRWHTGRPVFVDSRGLLAYSPRFMLDYVGMWSSRERWESVLAAYDVEVALVWRAPLKSMFRSSPDWRELSAATGWSGSRHAIFVRRNPPPLPSSASR